MSGFTNKILGMRKHSPKKPPRQVPLHEMRTFLPTLDAAAAAPTATPSLKLELVLRALVIQPSPSDAHFKRQSELCLSERYHVALALPSMRVPGSVPKCFSPTPSFAFHVSTRASSL